MRAPNDPRQGQLFGEVIESRWTRDTPFEYPDGSFGTLISRPAGPGWRVADYRKDRKTLWQRRRPIILRVASRGGGGARWWS